MEPLIEGSSTAKKLNIDQDIGIAPISAAPVVTPLVPNPDIPALNT